MRFGSADTTNDQVTAIDLPASIYCADWAYVDGISTNEALSSQFFLSGRCRGATVITRTAGCPGLLTLHTGHRVTCSQETCTRTPTFDEAVAYHSCIVVCRQAKCASCATHRHFGTLGPERILDEWGTQPPLNNDAWIT